MINTTFVRDQYLDHEIFDVKPYLDRGVFAELLDYDYFRRARIEFGTITWPNEQDFSPETIETRMEAIGEAAS